MSSVSLCLSFQSLKNKQVEEMCLICRESFEPETSWGFFRRINVLGHDRHLFHPDCLKQWLYAEASCPTCRGRFSFESLKKVFEKFEESKILFKRKYAVILGSVATLSSLAGRLSFSSLPPIGFISMLSVFASFKEQDLVKSTAIACATLGLGAVGAAAGLETEGVMLSACFGASLADELLKTKALCYFYED